MSRYKHIHTEGVKEKASERETHSASLPKRFSQFFRIFYFFLLGGCCCCCAILCRYCHNPPFFPIESMQIICVVITRASKPHFNRSVALVIIFPKRKSSVFNVALNLVFVYIHIYVCANVHVYGGMCYALKVDSRWSTVDSFIHLIGRPLTSLLNGSARYCIPL